MIRSLFRSNVKIVRIISSIGFVDVATFTTTVRGQTKLVHKGYEYTRYQTKVNFTKWRCCRTRWQQCKGKATTTSIGALEMVRAHGDHNHFPNDFDES